MKHPAPYSDVFIPVFAELLIQHNCQNVLDPLAGTGKLARVKDFGYTGTVTCNELEEEWIDPQYKVDLWTIGDCRNMNLFKNGQFDAIITSPVYGNRLSDHHNALDGSKRISYTHNLGRELTQGNSGTLQWGQGYRYFHLQAYQECARVLKPGGLMVVNISNHIRAGKEIDAVGWTLTALQGFSLTLQEKRDFKTPRIRRGANANLRVPAESLLIMQKTT